MLLFQLLFVSCWVDCVKYMLLLLSRAFFKGWFEGFWWSFISMTTVGYGDKTPRSVAGRLFSVLWISIGIIAYGLLTGIVYSEVNEVNSPPPPKIQDARVGCLL